MKLLFQKSSDNDPDPDSLSIEKLVFLCGPDSLKNDVFIEFSLKFENDITKLQDIFNVLPPDIFLRTNDYIDASIKFIENLMQNNYAYLKEGSIYFNVDQFVMKSHHYKKLTKNFPSINEKRSQHDFIIWKKGCQGEPIWPSPWGLGHPISSLQDSVMARFVLGMNNK
jgi:cysteinyl-tRNA synthetase